MACCGGVTPGSTPAVPITLGAWNGTLSQVEAVVQIAGLRRGRAAWVTGTDVARFIAAGVLREV